MYYDHASGQMLYGEQLINGHWYDFDESTGAMQYGFVYLSKSQKWVFYDRRMGWMLYGEHPIDGAWYLLDAHTGAVQYGWQGLGGKTVCYSWPSGKMLYGQQNVNNATYYSIIAPVLSIRGVRLSYRVITSEPLLEHLVTKSSRAGTVPFAFLETVSLPEWARRTRIHVRLVSCSSLRESPIMSRPIRRIWPPTA